MAAYCAAALTLPDATPPDPLSTQQSTAQASASLESPARAAPRRSCQRCGELSPTRATAGCTPPPLPSLPTESAAPSPPDTTPDSVPRSPRDSQTTPPSAAPDRSERSSPCLLTRHRGSESRP